MANTWLKLMNDLFKAHREKDVVLEQIILQELEKVEPEYADMLDAIDY